MGKSLFPHRTSRTTELQIELDSRLMGWEMKMNESGKILPGLLHNLAQ